VPYYKVVISRPAVQREVISIAAGSELGARFIAVNGGRNTTLVDPCIVVNEHCDYMVEDIEEVPGPYCEAEPCDSPATYRVTFDGKEHMYCSPHTGKVSRAMANIYPDFFKEKLGK
jgi:hypothetical protein